MTHSGPNLAQVPSVKAPYGEECRALFMVPKGRKLVGADASGLELRCLAHYMGRWDHGEYAKVILEGDIHSVNQTAAGLPTRDNAKTFIYAFLYGAGDAKIGSIIGKGKKAGAALKAKFLRGLPARGNLLEAVKKAAARGYVIGLDGRHIYVRSEHAALNTLLQGAGAIVMKKALVLLDDELHYRGYVPGVDYEFVLNIHDEFQIECREEIADDVAEAAVAAIRAAGRHFNFRCPLDGEAKVGRNWAETH
jgi:DNA polymerase I-like protein with 3'-5' exonuclease and polymerase domains